MALLVVLSLQQSWYKFSESNFYEKYFLEQTNEPLEELTETDTSSDTESIIDTEPKNDFAISDGDTLSSILTDAKISKENGAKIISAIAKTFNPKKLKIGHVIHFDFPSDTKENTEIIPSKITIRVSSTEEIEILNVKNEFISKINIIPLVRHIAHLTTNISNSFINSAAKFSLPHHAIMNLVKAYSYDVDFQRELKSGNKLEIIVEKFYTKEGKFSHIGDVLFSSLSLSDRKIELYQTKNKNGDQVYYNSDAISVVKQLLKTPINAARMSSGFGMRKHPVLGYSRMHKGVDFAAPIGTPILAAGSGTIDQIGRKGGYGKYIRIKHSDSYSTAYAHMKNFGKGLKKGSAIKQGQVIGYVGMTGITSGPHLHYEVLKNNQQINPTKLKFASETKLDQKELKKFKDNKIHIANLLKKIKPQTEIAG